MRVIDDNPECNLILTFNNDIQMILNATNYSDRERLIACIMTLRGFALAKLQGVHSVDKLTILHNQGIDLSQKILGYTPVDNGRGHYIQQVTNDYEGGLIRKLSEQMGSETKEEYQLNNVIEEILNNAAFCNLIKVPPN